MAFPPAKGKPMHRSAPNLPEDDKGNPVSVGKGGIKAALKVVKAGTRPAKGAGPDKTVNLF